MDLVLLSGTESELLCSTDDRPKPEDIADVNVVVVVRMTLEGGIISDDEVCLVRKYVLSSCFEVEIPTMGSTIEYIKKRELVCQVNRLMMVYKATLA